jgi:hypothetical protein
LCLQIVQQLLLLEVHPAVAPGHVGTQDTPGEKKHRGDNLSGVSFSGQELWFSVSRRLSPPGWLEHQGAKLDEATMPAKDASP